VFIERKRILEGSAATYAEEFRVEGFGRRETDAAHGVAENFTQIFAANAARIREEEGKKGVRG
jgi:hypothetical protein